MTTLYLDTEFNGFGGELISMALVSPEGHRWYGVRNCVFDDTLDLTGWVEENVIPKLDEGGHIMLDHQFRASLHGFLLRFNSPEIVCDWHADAEHFAHWLAGASYETSLDYACRITILKTPPGLPVSKNPHNALADAKALMLWHQETLKESDQ